VIGCGVLGVAAQRGEVTLDAGLRDLLVLDGDDALEDVGHAREPR
jgi:hypothetical protein